MSGGPMNKILNEQQLKAICDVLADTHRGLTKQELATLLGQSKIISVDDGHSNNGYTYQIGLSKREWLYNSFLLHTKNTHSFREIYEFIQRALNPVSYSDIEKRGKYEYLFEEINKVLLLVGLNVNSEGKVIKRSRAKSLEEVDRRVNSLKKHLYDRSIHHEVQKYCIDDYLRRDYYDAVFEAAKGLAQRVRDITGSGEDGSALFQEAFSTKTPQLFINALSTKSEKNEFMGLKELMESIFHLIRNPMAHTPKINWITNETEALDILTLVSVAHKYLDKSHPMPRQGNDGNA